MKYISFVDVLGTKNTSENENFEDYLTLITNFQYILISQSGKLKDCGRIHFFSDCAYIESSDIVSLLSYLDELRNELLQANIFIRGSIIRGVLGAICGYETEKFFSSLYNNPTLTKQFKKIKSLLSANSEFVNGTAFLSKDLSKAFFYENSIKAASFYIDSSLIGEAGTFAVKSGYIRDISKLDYVSFYDIRYDESLITIEFLDFIINHYTMANFSDVSYGRYYLSILITCIGSSDYSSLVYNSETCEFTFGPKIFSFILELRKNHNVLYSNAKGLEYLYLKLIDKIYSDFDERNETTKYILLNIFQNKKFLSKYQNKLSSISKDVISVASKYLLIKDYNELLKEKLL